jgi:TonB family protein
MTPIKESAEVASAPAASESLQSRGRSKPESAHLRADAVSLDVPVKVHGSLLPNVSPGAGPGGIGQAQPFEEQTSTMIVFPQGSVLKMSTPVSAGQVMVLTNLKSRQDAICRVLKVRAYGNGQSYVEIEFTSPQPGYWGVYFPSDAPETARAAQQQPVVAQPESSAAASPIPAAVSALQQSPAVPIEHNAPELSSDAPAIQAPAVKIPEPASAGTGVQQSPILPPRQPVAPKLPESSFASIGTKEEVLAPADATREPRAGSFADAGTKRSLGADREIGEAIDALIVPAAKTATPSRVESRESHPPATISTKPLEPQSAQTETRPPVPKQMFGVTLDSATPVTGKSSRQRGGKLWIGVGVAAVIAVAGGAAYYFHFRPSLNKALSAPAATASVPAPAAQPSSAQFSAAPATTQNAGAGQTAFGQSASQSAAPQSPDVAPTTDAVSDAAPESTFDKVEPSPKRRELASNKQSPSAKPEPSVAIPSAFGALNTRPVVANHEAGASAGAAPALNANEGPIEPNGSLPAVVPPPPSAPAAPKPVSNAPVRVGGKILPPRLVSSVLPVYPQIAQQAGVTGTVVIETTIDKEGRVVKTKVISGPELLRQAAVSALRQWKYEPSKLNGQPISIEIVVSIQFH